MTFTLILQVAPGKMEPLFKVTEICPEAKATPPGPVRVAEPPQLSNDGVTGLAKTNGLGRLSVTVVWVNVVVGSLLIMLIVSWLACPTQIVFGAKLLFNEGGNTAETCSVALAGSVLVILTGVPPSSPTEVNSPGGMVLIRLPGVVDVTVNDTVHSPGTAPTWAGTVPPFNLKYVAPGASATKESSVTVPPQVLDKLIGFATVMPAGKKS